MLNIKQRIMRSSHASTVLLLAGMAGMRIVRPCAGDDP